jgi:hypothetical protein
LVALAFAVKSTVTVQGPLPVTVTVFTVAVPTAVALTFPGPLPVVVGAVQPAGTTIVAIDPEVKAFGPLRNWNVKLLLLLPRAHWWVTLS